jgi:transcriptional regulator with XRE-family HTH domain
MDNQYSVIKSRLAKSIKARRKLVNLSQEALALEANVDRTYISQLERAVANPSLLILCRVAEILNCKVEELINEP